MMNYKLNYSLILIVIGLKCVFAQSFNQDKTALGNFMKRMYTNTKFEGVKVIDDYDLQYFISTITLEKSKYSSTSSMNRVAQVKAQSQANTFFNGSEITSDLIIKTTETGKKAENSQTTIETIEVIKENAHGFTQGLELLTNFENEDGTKMVFIFFRELKPK